MSSESHLRAQYEALLKENKALKGSVEKLERENHDLKRSVYELTLKYVSLDSNIRNNVGELMHLSIDWMAQALDFHRILRIQQTRRRCLM